MTYAEKLKHPLWQKKRLEILSLANFTCQLCGSSEKTLHVHHGYYQKGLMPWQYPDFAYHCLCHECHSVRDGVELEINQHLSSLSSQELVMFMGTVVNATFALGIDDMAESINKMMSEGANV